MSDGRDHFLTSFSERLISALKTKGHTSANAGSGVRVNELSEAVGCSHQMARRYVLGKALPHYKNVLAISGWLEVDPGWLLFGDLSRISKFDDRGLVGIDYDLLENILLKSFPLFKRGDTPEEVVKFLVDVIYDASQLKADRSTIIKMVQMAISSATRFSLVDSSEAMKKEPIKA